ncbi:MFS transporter [Methylosinus sp. H3A]|uniref:MFS transporter n=1 Tax=Methylosinus sp. H3A TaxID=2785786 RepID=UPI0018C20805|nr:MFS transporter [Methylosinus sp. H3A]MBG0808393.1 MFS transporter [Methylosinus sp. H3A]
MNRSVADRPDAGAPAFPVLGAISFCHFLNDMMQSLLPAVYPLLKGGFDLDFGQIGLLTLTYQITASLLQPLVGLYTDRRPQPYSLVVGMCSTLFGMLALAFAPSYAALLAAAMLMGIGSSIFHPESSRIARIASGGAHGLAQSLFQVGGNFGASLGPLLAAFFILPRGQSSLAWFALVALGGVGVVTALGHWFRNNGHARPRSSVAPHGNIGLSAKQRRRALAVLVALMFSKFVYLASLGNYYVFYLMSRFDTPPQEAQVYLFVFLATSAGGTVIGGAVGDRLGRKRVIWGSILGVLPFTLALPYVGLPATVGLGAVIGFMLSSAFPAILVYAQELTPNRIGAVSGLFFGFAFGMSGVGAAALGELADWTSIEFVFRACSVLPLIGLLAVFLPAETQRTAHRHSDGMMEHSNSK